MISADNKNIVLSSYSFITHQISLKIRKLLKKIEQKCFILHHLVIQNGTFYHHLRIDDPIVQFRE